MLIHIANNGVPLYLQIVDQVKGSIQTGRLLAGEELPAIRALAEQLLINPNTVARAYLELENQNLVTKKHGSGTYVSESASAFGEKEQMETLLGKLDEFLAEAARMGLSSDDLIKQIRNRSKNVNKKAG